MSLRRLSLLLAVFLLLTATGGLPLFMTSCSRPAAYTATYLDTFDTVLTVTVGATDRETANRISADIHAIALDLHRKFDIYHTYEGMNNLATVNAAAGKSTPVAVDGDVIALLALGQKVYTLSEGRVNIMLGAVLSQWHDCRTAGDRIPDGEALATALGEHCAMESLAVDEAAGTVRITDPAASLDVGAIAKSYAAARILAYAREAEVESLLVNLGGHVLAIGSHPDGDPWRVAVRNPADGSVLRTLEVEDASVVTSGDDQRTFTVDGVTYHHLIDPATGYPATHHRSVTLVAPLSLTAEADGISTALFLMTREEGEALLATLTGAEAIWVDGQGSNATD